MSSGLCGCVFSFLACGVRVSDVTAVSGPGWGSRVWRRTLWSAWMCWKGPESPSGPDAPWRRASDWLSWRLWCRCWRSMSVTLWMLSDGIFIRWGEQRALLTHSTAVYLFYIYFNWMSLLLLKYDFWAPSTTLPLKWLTGPNSHFYRIHPLFVFQPAALWDSRVRTDSGEERGASCHQQPEEVDAAAACGKKPGGTFLCFAKLHKHLHNIIRIIMRN